MKKLLISALLMGTLLGCANYQVGDISKGAVQGVVELNTVREQYCKESDPFVRKALLTIIHSHNPVYPTDGICTNILTVIVNGNTLSE